MHRKQTQIATSALKGISALNQGAFFEAHEHFEAAWRDTSEPEREFYRALLHLSGGYFRLTQNNPSAARKFFAKADGWLRQFPQPYLTVDTRRLAQDVQALLAALDENQPPDQGLSDHFKPIQFYNAKVNP